MENEMTVKTTGAELKRFYADKEFWPDNGDVYHDDEYITVDGADMSESWDIYQIPDAAKITVANGRVFGVSEGDEPSFESYFKKWRKKQTTASFVVECDLAKKAELVALIKANGAKVV